MAQFDVYAVDGGLLLDCQSDVLQRFSSRVVVPLLAAGAVRLEFPRLTPRLRVGDDDRVMATHLIAAVDRRMLGKVIASLSSERYTIQAALDILTGSGF